MFIIVIISIEGIYIYDKKDRRFLHTDRVRKLIDDAFATAFITDTLVTCMCCSFMQEIAEYPLMLVYLVLWHYRFTEDREYLKINYPKVKKLLDAYKRDYETEGLLKNLDKWCVVDWPHEARDGYDYDLYGFNK